MENKGDRKSRFEQKEAFNFKNGRYLINFIKKIPNIEKVKFRLSDEECEVVGQNGNLTVIGRSGTGKTTCALIRLFAIEVMFKNELGKNIWEQKKQQEKYSFKSKYLELATELKSIFLTASPILITQIKSRYEQLHNHVEMELRRKEKEKNQKSKQGGTEKTQQNSDNKPKKQRNHRLYGFEQLCQAEKQERQRENKYFSLNNLKDKDYPGFFTIKQFIIMLDGCLKRPFFVRKINKEMIQQSEGFRTWRNKNLTSYKINLGNLNEFDHPDRYKYSKQTNKRQFFAQQCTWEMFKNQFWRQIDWKQILKHYNYQRQLYQKITALAAWTQIISTIEGSRDAHLFKEKYLPFEKYLKQSKNHFFGDIEKKAIYEIFLHYKEWKFPKNSKKHHFFDSVDVANHILVELERGRENLESQTIIEEIFGKIQNKPNLHYLFLDEVQDLPPSLFYLASLLFKNGLYYSGDTAQAIQKGVSFKFSDIKEMFENGNSNITLNCPVEHKLTMNFRSHSQILNLANSTVEILLQTFPETIDRMKKQTAQNIGPKPIIFNTESINGHHQYKIQELLIPQGQKLSCVQAIIVRNEQAKQKLSEQMKQMDGIVLTIQECKGLEYDDVVIYNFFDKNLSNKWAILKYIDLYPQRGKTIFDKSDLNLSEYQELITELKMLYTMITRARCTLIFFDQNIPEQLLHIWFSHNLVIQQASLSYQYTQDLKKFISQYKKNNLESTESWGKKGFNFFLKKEFKLALQCYMKSGEQYKKACMKIEGIVLHEKAEKVLFRLEQLYKIKNVYYEMDDDEISNFQWKEFLKECQLKITPDLLKAADNFEKLQLYFDAANCYFQAQYYEQAMKNYQKCQNKSNLKIAFCYQKLKAYQLAASYFLLSQQYKRMILILEKTKNHKLCLQQLLKCPRQFKQFEFFYRKNLRSMLEKQQNFPETFQSYKIWFSHQSESRNTPILAHFSIVQSILNEIKQRIKRWRLLFLKNIQQIENQIKKTHGKIQKQLSSLFFHYEEYLFMEVHEKLKLLKNTSLEQQENDFAFKANLKEYFYQKFNEIIEKYQIMCDKLTKTIPISKIKIFFKQIYIDIANFLRNEGRLESKKQIQIHEKQVISKIGQIQRRVEDIQNEIKRQLKIFILNYNQVKRQKINIEESFRSGRSLSMKKNSSLLKKSKQILNNSGLPAIPFTGTFIRIINSYEELFSDSFQKSFLAQTKGIYINLEALYQERREQQNNQQHQKILSPFLIDFDQQNEIRKMKIIRQILHTQKIKLSFFKNINFLNFDQVSQLQVDQDLDHRFLTHFMVKRELYQKQQPDLQLLSELQIIYPMSYLFYAFKLGLKYCIVNAIGMCLSSSSKNYRFKSMLNSKRKSQNMKDQTILAILNPEFFDFNMLLTKYTEGKAKLVVFQNCILLGFVDKLLKYLPDHEKISLQLLFMKQQLYKNKQGRKLSQPQLQQFESSKLVQQFIMLNQYMETPWILAKNKFNVELTFEQKNEVKKDVLAKISSVKEQIQKYFKKQNAFLERATELMNIYIFLISGERQTVEETSSKNIKNSFQNILKYAQEIQYKTSKMKSNKKNFSQSSTLRTLFSLFFTFQIETKFQKMSEIKQINIFETSIEIFKKQIDEIKKKKQKLKQNTKSTCQKKFRQYLLDSIQTQNIIRLNRNIEEKIKNEVLEDTSKQQNEKQTQISRKIQQKKQQIRQEILKQFTKKLNSTVNKDILSHEDEIINSSILMFSQNFASSKRDQQKFEEFLKESVVQDLKVFFSIKQSLLQQILKKEQKIDQMREIQVEMIQIQQKFVNVENILQNRFNDLQKYEKSSYLDEELRKIKNQIKNKYFLNQRRQNKENIICRTGVIEPTISFIFYFEKLEQNIQQFFGSFVIIMEKSQIQPFELDKELKQLKGDDILLFRFQRNIWNKKEQKSEKRYLYNLFSLVEDSKYEMVELILTYFSYQKYKSFQKQVDKILEKISAENRKQKSDEDFNFVQSNFQLFVQYFKYFISHSLKLQNYFYIFEIILRMFQCKIIKKKPYLNIFQFFVLVSIQSPIFARAQNENCFGYYIDQERKSFIMKFTDVLSIIESKMEIKFVHNEQENVYFRNIRNQDFIDKNHNEFYDVLMSFDKKHELLGNNPEKNKLLQRVQENRCEVISFLAENQFIAHQSSQFIYHQLRCYSDILLILMQKKGTSLSLTFEKDVRKLERQFKEWRKYAARYEFSFKREQ